MPTLPGFELVWHDEFSGNSLNTDYWECMLGDGSQYGIPGWGNGEAQCYTNSNARVENGELIITAKRESVGGKNYTSARLRTAGKVSTRYGRIEARISLPEVVGMWPAFWMLPESSTPYGGWPYSGEIDIMEARGSVASQTTCALHFSSGGSRQYIANSRWLDESISNYHVYAIEWTQDEITWFVDDLEIMTVTSDRWQGIEAGTNAPFNTDFHVLLNLAVGGHFDGYSEPDAQFTECDMRVDYVRIYKFKY